MFDLTENIGAWIVAGLTWLIIMCTVVQVSKFYANFCIARKTLETNMTGLTGQIKRLQSTMTELLVEMRKTNRIQQNLLDLKQAEMTGDFEIVEEPIVAENNEEAEAEAAPEPMPAAPSAFPKL